MLAAQCSQLSSGHLCCYEVRSSCSFCTTDLGFQIMSCSMTWLPFREHQDTRGEKHLKVSKAWLMLSVGSKIRTSPPRVPPTSQDPTDPCLSLPSLLPSQSRSRECAWKPTCELKNSINFANLKMLRIYGYNMQFCSFSPFPCLYT